MSDEDLCPGGGSCIDGQDPDFGYTCGEMVALTITAGF